MATQRRSARKVEEDTSADDVSVDVIDVESVEEDNKVVQETQTESNEIAIFATHPMHWPGVGDSKQGSISLQQKRQSHGLIEDGLERQLFQK